MTWKRSCFIPETTHGGRKKKCILWSEINKLLSNTHFRRIFRMNRDCFTLLCNTLICGISEIQIKSEAYIDSFLRHKDIMRNARIETTGGYIVSEINMVISLRLFAGINVLNLVILFGLSQFSCGTILYDVLEWIINTNISGIDMMNYLNDDDPMRKMIEVSSAD